MSDLRELYQEMILDHCKRPRNFRGMVGADRQADGFNRLCGDKLRVFVKLAGGKIEDISFEGDGCCISKASSSMMTEALRGKTVEEAHKLFEEFHGVLTGPPDEIPDAPNLGKLAVFAGVREFPVRVKCATLAWHTLESALKDDAAKETERKPVSTE